MNNDNNRTYKTFNLQKYYIEVKLYNPDGDEKILNPESILHLVIEDDIHFWPIRGFLVYENPYEIIERKMVPDNEIDSSDLDAETRAKLKAVRPYIFRNDGKDYLDITIRPELEEGSDLPIKQLPKDIWEMNYKCVIYDKEDVEVANITQKLKKFYFWDLDYQKMLDKKIQWSTATSSLNETSRSKGEKYIASQASDNERKMFTGTAIKSILTDNNFKCSEIDFDKGSTKIFYSAYQDLDIWSNIEYILGQHMSEKTSNIEPSEMDICIFNKIRATQEFELVPLYKLFEKAGADATIPKEFQTEHLYFDETGNKISSSPNKAPVLDKRDTSIDVKLTKIKKYQFVDMSGSDNTELLVTTPVLSYDFKNKTFGINMADSNISILEEKLKKIYIEKKLLSKNGFHPLITLNANKIANNTINPTISTRCDKPAILKKGLGKLLYSSMFLNQCLAFELEGATIRQSGRFVGIDRQTSSDNTLDYKLCGQWFITKVKHNFFHNMYINEIIAVKMHSYDNLNISNKF